MGVVGVGDPCGADGVAAQRCQGVASSIHPCVWSVCVCSIRVCVFVCVCVCVCVCECVCVQR